jgi:hypothetical protein
VLIDVANAVVARSEGLALVYPNGSLGWPADSRIDLGGIAAARASEHAFYLLGALFGALGTPRLNFAVIR